MKLVYRDGCVSTTLLIDDVSTVYIDIEEFKNVLHKLIDKENDLSILQDIFRCVVVYNGEYECSDEPCECCGDFTETYTFDVDI